MTDQDKAIVVVGGGISGLTAALEAAETGQKVVLVEKNPHLGGRVAQLYNYFPKLCPPYCGLEINFRRIRSNANLTIYTLAEVTGVQGEPGNYTVTIKQSPRYVNDKCTACGKCAEAVESTIPNPFNYGMDQIKAAYLPHDMAFPPLYVIDPSIAGGEEGKKAAEACPYGAVDLADSEKEITVSAPAVVWTTGWTPYDPAKLETYDFNNQPNLITNVMMERLAAINGPTSGAIQRPGDGQVPANVAFVQCAGSRDENHLPFCSTICCLASLKQATYIREQNPESTVTIYYIDIRAMDRYEDFYTKVKADENVKFVKSKIAKIYGAEGGNLTLEGEDTTSGAKFKAEHDLVVLATGMQPNTSVNQVPASGVEYDEYGYLRPNPGIIGAGTVRCASNVATCVQESTAAALKAIQAARR